MRTKMLNVGKALLAAVSVFLVMSMVAVVSVEARRIYCYENTFINEGVGVIRVKNPDGTSAIGLVLIRVKNPDGTPATGVGVVIKDPSGEIIREGITGRYGWYVTSLSFGDGYKAIATANGLTAEKTFNVQRLFTRVLLTLEPSESDCVIVTVLHDGSPVEDADVIIVGTALTGTTGTDGKVSWCPSGLDPYTDYTVDASKGSWSGSTDFTTNSAGGADVTVTI